MKNNKIFGCLLSLFLLIQSVSFAQNEQDSMIFKAMDDEMQRGFKELQLSNQHPFFMEYVVMTSKVWAVTSVLGATSFKQDGAISNCVGLRLLLGDYQTDSDFKFVPMLYGQAAAEELDYNNIRRAFWNSADFAYKTELKNYEKKLSYLEKHPRPEEEANLADFTKLPEVTTTILESPKLIFNLDEWEKNVQELSAIFNNYPKLFTTSVEVVTFEQVLYKKTTEGMTLRVPQTYAHIVARAAVKTKEDAVEKDQFAVIVPFPEQLPNMEELKKQITDFAEKLSQFNNTICMEEPYEGPVLFVGEVAREMFRFNTTEDWALLSHRPILGKDRMMSWFGRMNQPVMSKHVSVRSYANMTSYKGQNVYGGYTIDAEGIKPEEGLVLVDKGVMKARLNNRIPDVEDPRSTGSCRFPLSTRYIGQKTAPGIIHITVDKTVKEAKMKQLLLKTAKKQGLKYAYVYRQTKRAMFATYLYRVDVETGVETLVTNAKIGYAEMMEDKNILAFSDEERVDNCFWSNAIMATFIHPNSVLFKDIRIDIEPVRKQAKEAIER